MDSFYNQPPIYSQTPNYSQQNCSFDAMIEFVLHNYILILLIILFCMIFYVNMKTNNTNIRLQNIIQQNTINETKNK